MKYWLYIFADWISDGLITHYHGIAVSKSEENIKLRRELAQAQATITRLATK